MASEPTCSFCGKDQHQVDKLIAGPGLFICDQCVQLCNNILNETEEIQDESVSHLPKPKEMGRTSRRLSNAAAASNTATARAQGCLL